MTVFGFLIELPDPHKPRHMVAAWLAIDYRGCAAFPYWTTDSFAAVRFARKEDAEAILALMKANEPRVFAEAIVTEHSWS